MDYSSADEVYKGMRIERIRIVNFKSFRDSDWIELAPSFNVVVGQNNSGKSAFLEALTLGRATPNPHRNHFASEPHEIPSRSYFHVDISLTAEDFLEGFALSGNDHSVPVDFVHGRSLEYYKTEIVDKLSENNYLLEYPAGGSPSSRRSPSHGLFSGPPTGYASVRISDNRQELRVQSISQPGADGVPEVIRFIDNKKIVFMGAKRAFNPHSAIGIGIYLSENSDNLPTVIYNIKNGYPALFDKLLSHVAEIFPEIGDITVVSVPNTDSQLDIRIWAGDYREKVSQSISLKDSGTGVAQVIAILCVAILYEQAVIIIDEINSFLHPSAVKSLLRILRTRYDRHQYVISTHSTDVISWSDPDKVLLLKKIGEESSVSVLSWRDVVGMRAISRDLGVSMVDVFGADRIIWVEGETEEICFPILLTAAGSPLPRNVAIVKVIGTGDLSLDAKGVELAYKIYTKISSVAAPLVESAVFSLDREGMDKNQVARLMRKANADLHLLPRRCIENYLINPIALTAFFEHLGELVELETIREWLVSHGGEEKYRAKIYWEKENFSPVWYSEVMAAKMLEDMVQELTSTRQQYRKTSHSPWILQWMLNQMPDELLELTRYVQGLLK